MQDTSSTMSNKAMVRMLVCQMEEALRDDRIDEAQALWEQLCSAFPQARAFVVFPVLISIQRGRIQEALYMIEESKDFPSPDLKALCLYLLHDASWHGYATDLAESSPEPYVRQAMLRLLGRADADTQ